MDIHLLRTFVAAFEEANFTRAAKRLNATQPGVSAQIAALEAAVGTALFDRNSRSVIPTLAGKHLYPRALQLIRDLNSAAQEVRSLSGIANGRVAVGISPTLSKAIIAPVLSRFLETYPRVDVRVHEEYSDALSSLIESRDLDLAFVTRSDERSGISCRKAFSDCFVVASGTRSGLDPDRPLHLGIEPYFKIVVPTMFRRDLYRVLEDPLRTGRIVAARTLEMDGLAGTFEFVARSNWVALLPAAAAYNHPESSGVRFSPIAGEEIGIDYFLVHAKTEPVSIAARAFIDLVTVEMNRATMRWRSRQCAPVHERNCLQRHDRSGPTSAGPVGEEAGSVALVSARGRRLEEHASEWLSTLSRIHMCEI